MRNMKFIVDSPEHSIELQRWLHSLGYRWSTCDPLKYVNFPYLYTNSSGYIQYGDCHETFKTYNYALSTLGDDMTKIEEIRATIAQLQQQVADLEKPKVMPEVGGWVWRWGTDREGSRFMLAQVVAPNTARPHASQWKQSCSYEPDLRKAKWLPWEPEVGDDVIYVNHSFKEATIFNIKDSKHLNEIHRSTVYHNNLIPYVGQKLKELL